MITATMFASAIIVALVVALIFQGIALSRANDQLRLQRTINEATTGMLDSIRLPPVSVEYDPETGDALVSVGGHSEALRVIMMFDDGTPTDHGKQVLRLLKVMSHSAPPRKARR